MTTEEQFLELVQENRQKLCGVCRYYAALCDAVCEEDLFQEIVLNLWKSYPRYVKRPACQPSTWLYRVALNVAISQVRKSGTRKFQSIRLKRTYLPEFTNSSPNSIRRTKP